MVGGALVIGGIILGLFNAFKFLSGWGNFGGTDFVAVAACTGSVSGVLGAAAIMLGMRSLQNRLHSGAGLMLIGILALPAGLLFFATFLAVVGSVFLLLAGLLAYMALTHAPVEDPSDRRG